MLTDPRSSHWERNSERSSTKETDLCTGIPLPRPEVNSDFYTTVNMGEKTSRSRTLNSFLIKLQISVWKLEGFSTVAGMRRGIVLKTNDAILLRISLTPQGVIAFLCRARSNPSFRSRQMIKTPAVTTIEAPSSMVSVGTSPNTQYPMPSAKIIDA